MGEKIAPEAATAVAGNLESRMVAVVMAPSVRAFLSADARSLLVELAHRLERAELQLAELRGREPGAELAPSSLEGKPWPI
jgi:hypothetical protein